MNDASLVLAIVTATLVLFLAMGAALLALLIAHRRQTQLAAARIAYEHELRAVAGEVQEQTLKSVAEELHDGIGQQLTLLRLQLETHGLRHPDCLPGLQTASETLAGTAEAVRSLSHALHGQLVQELPLGLALEREITRLQSLRHIHTHWLPASDPTAGLAPDQALIAFRLFQEAVNNTLKHAEASTLWVTLQSGPFELSVRDDGRGYDTAVMREGAGLKTTVTRATLAGLLCVWESAPGAGSTMILRQQRGMKSST